MIISILFKRNLVFGKILSSPMRVNGHTFYRMTVIFTESPDKEVIVHDTFRSNIVDHFFRIKDENNHIDIL